MHSTTILTYKMAIVLRQQVCDVISPYVWLRARSDAVLNVTLYDSVLCNFMTEKVTQHKNVIFVH